MSCPSLRRPAPEVAPGPRETDEALLVCVGRGEAAALAQLHQRYAGMVFATALRVLADRQEAEDVTQDLFVQVWLQAWRFDPARGRCAAWLRRMAHNLAVSRVLRRRPASRLPDDPEADGGQLPDPHVDVEREVWAAMQRRAIGAALAALPARERTVIVQAYYGGMSQGQIAARTGLPLGTVKSRTRHALRRLRALVGGGAADTGALVAS